jgi:hypothetical protein
MPTEQQLRTVQPENPDLTINRERLRTLHLVAGREARRSAGGLDIVAPAAAGYGSRLGGKVRELWAAGLVVLGTDSLYQLTDAGARRRAQAKDEYDAQRITSSR